MHKSNPQKIAQLSEHDRKILKFDLFLYSTIPTLLFIAICLLLAFSSVVVSFFVKIKDGYVDRGILILILLVLPFTFFMYVSLLKTLDLISNKKRLLVIENYKIVVKLNKAKVISNSSKFKIEIPKETALLIDAKKTIQIEITKFSKTILFISNDNRNLL